MTEGRHQAECVDLNVQQQQCIAVCVGVRLSESAGTWAQSFQAFVRETRPLSERLQLPATLILAWHLGIVYLNMNALRIHAQSGKHTPKQICNLSERPSLPRRRPSLSWMGSCQSLKKPIAVYKQWITSKHKHIY